jgi:diguanylate cyclase (GGDEF)-like protein
MLIVTFGLFLVLCIAFLKFITGPEYAFSILYIIPVLLVSWFVGFPSGLVIAFAGAGSWLVADMMNVGSFSSPAVPIINEALRLILFSLFAYAASSLRNRLLLSHSDYLTGLANTRHFIEMAAVEIKRARRYGHPLTATFIDLDDFKKINDLYGHHVGDMALIAAADCLKKGVRDIDIVARFGGDEFIIMMPETSGAEAVKVIERLQSSVLDCMKKNDWPATFSAGVATFETLPDDPIEILRQTDELMYAAKSAGKNAIMHQTITGAPQSFQGHAGRMR